MTSPKIETAPSRTPIKLPIGSLLALAAAGFLTAMPETLPAGILPALSADLGVTEATAGQTVTVYAIGRSPGPSRSSMRRKAGPRRRLLVMALSGYTVTSLLVAVSPFYALTLVIRFATGVLAGVLWGIALCSFRKPLAAATSASCRTLVI
ncbi:MFS transporter [Arthrobacter monumenti]